MEGAKDLVHRIVSSSDLNSVSRAEFLEKVSAELGAELVDQNKDALLAMLRTAVREQLESKLPMAIARAKQVRRTCLLYTSPSPRDQRGSRMPSSA